ncbi:MAG: TadA family conjugal transfer-associated ATPase [Micrococcales bacterium]|nr:TadA family conjugal transfer-associated ATPase [Micrococcales bacterium]
MTPTLPRAPWVSVSSGSRRVVGRHRRDGGDLDGTAQPVSTARREGAAQPDDTTRRGGPGHLEADPGLVAQVRALLGGRVDPAGVADAVSAVLAGSATVLGPRALARTVEAVRGEVLGAGPLQPLLDDPRVCDVLVNGPRDVWVERDGALVRASVDLGDAAGVRALAVRLAAVAGRRLDDASPAVDGRLPDGTRLHALLPPLSGRCAVLSLRVPRSRPFTMSELVAAGTLAPASAGVLAALVERRANLLVTGSTGVGKTTLLTTLLGLVDPAQRIVVIEESRELSVDHPHVVSLSARPANVEGAGGVGLGALVRHALRMRPDRIVLGECRGAEVLDVLAALNTGHEGGFATLHANAATEVPARLEALGALAGTGREAMAAQAVSALDAVVHLRRDSASGRRYVAQVGVVGRGPDGSVRVEVALAASPGGDVARGVAWPRLAALLGYADTTPDGGLVLRPRPPAAGPDLRGAS